MTMVVDTMCGFCSTAWDLVYKRCRSNTSIGKWLSYCRVGGCDADIWDFVDDDGALADDEVPQFMPHLFHRRDRDRPHGWQFSRKSGSPDGQRVQYTPEEFQEKELQQRIEQKADEIEWDEDPLNEEDEIEWE